MDQPELIQKIVDRIERCRRLAASTTDPQVAIALREMADQGEADLRALKAQNAPQA